mgnify:CR=1 FL=1
MTEVSIIRFVMLASSVYHHGSIDADNISICVPDGAYLRHYQCGQVSEVKARQQAASLAGN